MRLLVEEAGLQGLVEVDSAGTNAFRVGGEPDARSRDAARERGIELRGPCRQFEREDFGRFDYLIAMDRQNYHDLLAQAPRGGGGAKVALLRSFEPELAGELAGESAGDSKGDSKGEAEGDEVPDPYIGARGFDRVFEICLAGCRGLLEHLSEEHDLA